MCECVDCWNWERQNYLYLVCDVVSWVVWVLKRYENMDVATFTKPEDGGKYISLKRYSIFSYLISAYKIALEPMESEWKD